MAMKDVEAFPAASQLPADDQGVSAEGGDRKVYQKPEIAVLGDIEDLTFGTTGANGDVGTSMGA